ncbi:hypothetical protein EW145_g8576 [Phellinidium pouzarii]|uniref:Uncharacterized protein n=1 Tax=Phellinidium pouzarii TaxID=167371 RepID=A0A4S4K4Y4_9AGAM|nr:hypothetical protein EW145_g8576 [Phellinidium pouzarii]
MSIRTRLSLAVLALVASPLQHAAAQITSNATCLAVWQDVRALSFLVPLAVVRPAHSHAQTCSSTIQRDRARVSSPRSSEARATAVPPVLLAEYDVSALVDSQHYVGPDPSQANPCLCSTVMYSVMGACSTCQNATLVPWTSWATSCSSVFVDLFPEDIPADTAVPGWAYENVTAANIFNPSQAVTDSCEQHARPHTPHSRAI